jgi:hypothetical protein
LSSIRIAPVITVSIIGAVTGASGHDPRCTAANHLFVVEQAARISNARRIRQQACMEKLQDVVTNVASCGHARRCHIYLSPLAGRGRLSSAAKNVG